MTKNEALRLALEALEKLFGIPDKWTGEGGGDVAVWRLGGSYRTQQAIIAIKAALLSRSDGEAKDEPVDFEAIIDDIEAIDCRYRGDPSYDRDAYWMRNEVVATVKRHASFYTTPPKQEAKDERVQVSPLQFVEMVMEKEDCIGKPIIWAEWPNKENK